MSTRSKRETGADERALSRLGRGGVGEFGAELSDQRLSGVAWRQRVHEAGLSAVQAALSEPPRQRQTARRDRDGRRAAAA